MSKKARVIAVNRDLYKVKIGDEVFNAIIPGKWNLSSNPNDFPCVGDWVILDGEVITKICERKNKLSRKASGKKHIEQIFATNIDYGFIVSSVNNEFNIDKIYRFYILIKSSDIKPVIVLSKADLTDDISFYIDIIESRIKDVEIITTSSYNTEGIEILKKYFTRDITGIFLGSSGVGKSTLINTLIDKEVQSTREIRSDDKGRHVTTNRQLFDIPGLKGSIIDSQGIREIQFSQLNLDKDIFNDIYLLSTKCKFRDCSHEGEPGCEVKKAIEEGRLSENRLKDYKKYRREIYLNNLEFDKAEAIYNKKRVKKQSKLERFTKR